MCNAHISKTKQSVSIKCVCVYTLVTKCFQEIKNISKAQCLGESWGKKAKGGGDFS